MRAGSSARQIWRSTLALPCKIDQASDPFFGRVGQMMAVAQIQQALKFELLVPLHSEEKPTACMSFNYHRDHFGLTWELRDARPARPRTRPASPSAWTASPSRCSGHTASRPRAAPAATRDALGL